MIPELWLDNSKIGTLERCPREFALRYLLHLSKTKATTAQAFGTAIHETIEQAISYSLDPTESAAKALDLWPQCHSEAFAEVLSEIPEEDLWNDYRYELSTGQLALLHLFSSDGALYSLLQMTESVVGTELQLRFKSILGWEFLGPADIVITTRSGQTYLIDIKTTGWAVDSWASKTLVDTQLHSYALAFTKAHHRPHGAAYLVLQVTRRMLKSGNWSNKPTLKSEIFPTAVTDDQLERMNFRIESAILEIQGRSSVCSWPCKWSACMRYNQVCSFFPLCERFWDDFDPDEVKATALDLGFIENRWHPFGEPPKEAE